MIYRVDAVDSTEHRNHAYGWHLADRRLLAGRDSVNRYVGDRRAESANAARALFLRRWRENQTQKSLRPTEANPKPQFHIDYRFSVSSRFHPHQHDTDKEKEVISV
jgi:hypothetical protein